MTCLPRPTSGTSAKDALAGFAMRGGTEDYLSTDPESSPEKSEPQLPAPRSVKLRIGDPDPPKPKQQRGPSLRERKPKVEPVPLAPGPPKVAKVPDAAVVKQQVAGAKRAYKHTPEFLHNQEARRAAKQMKALSSGSNA